MAERLKAPRSWFLDRSSSLILSAMMSFAPAIAASLSATLPPTNRRAASIGLRSRCNMIMSANGSSPCSLAICALVRRFGL